MTFDPPRDERPLPHEPLPEADHASEAEAPATPIFEPPERRRRRRSQRRREKAARRRRIALAVLAAVVLTLTIVGGALAVFRYLPALDEARSLREDVEAIGSRITEAGIGIDRAQLEAIESELDAARDRLEELDGFLDGDPLLGVARGIGPFSDDVEGADGVVAAAGHLFDAADSGLLMGRRFVEVKERQASDPDGASSLTLIVETMATSREFAADASESMGRARETLAGVPEGLAGPIESARAAMARRLEAYGPLLDAYVDVSEHLPDMLGWSEPKRYLVLTQNPAELRPTGGYTGSYGLITLDRGRITERLFQDIYLLDLPNDRYPFIEPPQELADYLLGQEQPWQLADANWSPHFPTSAQDAIRLYTNESGDADVDGVLAINTYTVDELLRITGPITVPDYDVTIAPGETTLKVLERTREADAPGENRKAILSALADELIPALLSVSTERWGELLGQLDTFRSERLLMAWFADADHQAVVEQHGFDGAVRQVAGDFIYPVDSNVAPTSKLNHFTTRSLELAVQIDEFGNARNTLEIAWQNGYDTPAFDPLRELPAVGGPNLGNYFRLIVPERSRVESVSGGTVVEINTPATLATLASDGGPVVVGNYVAIPPGTTSLAYSWISPYAADANADGGTYRLTIQKQPGLVPGPVSITITVPAGFTITDVGQPAEGVSVSGRTATFQTSLETDIELELRYGSDGG